MATRDRRAFLIQTGSALSGIAFLRFSHGDWALGSHAWEPVDIATLGHAILPSELGPNGIDRVCEGFRTWLAEFPDRVQLMNGWGSAEVRYGPPDPGPRWLAQLHEMEETAQRAHGRSFGDLSRQQQRDLTRSAIGIGRPLPGNSPANAEHVALGLLAFFFSSPEATNLCYRAEIHPEACRPLETVGEKPPPLGSGG